MEKSSRSDHHDGTPQSVDLVLQRWISIQDRQALANCVTHDLVQPLSDIVNRVWLCRELSRGAMDVEQLQESLSQIEDDALRAVEMIRLAHRLFGAQTGGERSHVDPRVGDTVS